MEAETKLLKVSEIAARFGVSTRCVRYWIVGGKLKAYRIGRRFFVRPEDVEKFIVVME